MTEEEELEQLMQDALAERDGETEDTETEEVEEELETEGEEREDFTEDEEETETETEEEQEDEEQEEQDTEEEEEISEPTFEPIEVDVGGHSVTISSKEEMLEFVKKGASTFDKPQETHLEEKLILEQGKLSSDDLKLLVEAKNGSKEAIAKLAKQSNVDLLELEEDMADNYKQTIQYQAPTEVDKVAQEIMQDEVHAQDFRDTVSKLPQDFVNTISQDATLLRQFSDQLKDGIAKEVIPEAIKASMVNGTPFIQNYAQIGQKMYQERTEKTEEKRVVDEKVKDLRKKASVKKGTAKVKSSALTDGDIWDMSDAEFAEYQANFEE
ncbi:MAG: hypothetical protein K0U20_09420 [Proteobacteria bacterium]|nr:hypothetical protein [Pseudomonadota bacterium]MCH9735800.1 hypothetical protein [Actinomycetes bacterium]